MDSAEHPTSPVREFALQLQQALRESTDSGSETWRAVVEEGLSAAYGAGDVVALCDVVQAIVSLLDAQGRLRDALSEIAHAISMAGTEANALTMLHSMRATLLAACGEIQLARQAVTDAERFAATAQLPFAVAKSRTNCAAARWAVFDPGAPSAGSFDIEAPSAARLADALFLMSYLIPYDFAVGARAAAHPWLRTLRLRAAAAHHEYRLADARVFEAAQAAVVAPVDEITIGDVPKWHWMGNWRAEVLRFRADILHRRWAGAERSMQALLRARRRAGNARVDDCDGFELLLDALLDRSEGDRREAQLPGSVHIFNLAAVLAAGEAVATDGSQVAAASWYHWFETDLPPQVRTSLEWPVSGWRIQALLALRAGNERAAKRNLERALEWAKAAEYPVELAIAQVQLSELLRHRSVGAERVWRDLRAEGSAALRNMGLDVAPIAYAVARTAPAAGKDGLTARLTPRETEVLAHLAEGRTYRAAGAQMGIKWTTVQTLAHRCYEKLEVSGRQAAVMRARELGIL